MTSASDNRRRNSLVLAVKRAIQAVFTAEDWQEFGYLVDMRDWIGEHPRLLRSLFFGDDDYSSNVLSAIEEALRRDPANLQTMIDIPKVQDWIQNNEPDVYAELLGFKLPATQAIKDAVAAAAEFDIADHIKRINAAVEDDPALAVGSTKELLESVMKKVLAIEGAEISQEDMPKLLKNTQAALGLDPKDVDGSAPGAESFRRLLGALAQIVISVIELRNLYGTGHGKTGAPGLDPAAARLVVSAGTAAAVYLMQRYTELKEATN